MTTHTHATDPNQEDDRLDAYTASLLAGEPSDVALLRQMEAISPALAGLARLSGRLHAALTPVHPDEDFVERLHDQLEEMHARQAGAATRWHRVIRGTTRVSTRAGAAFSVLAVLTLAARIIGSIVVLAIYLSNRRRAQSASA
jgi:hypothetical protein